MSKYIKVLILSVALIICTIIYVSANRYDAIDRPIGIVIIDKWTGCISFSANGWTWICPENKVKSN